MRGKIETTATLGLFLMMSLFVWSPSALAGDTLSLDDYLNQVRTKHDGLKGAQKSAQGAKEGARESRLIYAPNIFANIQITSDAKPTQVPLFMGTRTDADSYSLGVSKLFDWGMQAKVEYDVNYLSLVGVDPNFLPLNPYYDARPYLELSQSFWRNGFGSEARATSEMQESQQLAQSYADSFQVKQLLLQAEMDYWRLALAKETTRVERESLDRAAKIRDFEAHQARLELADRADLLQAEAAYEARALELQAAQDEERAAARDFNSLIGVEAENVAGQLTPLTPELLASLKVPQAPVVREDLLAAEEQQKAALSSYQLALERNEPTLDAVGSVALNGRSRDLPPALGNSYQTIKPTLAIGLKFMAPLDFGLISDDKRAALKVREGAELVYRRKQYEQKHEWDELTKKLSDLRRRLDLSEQIEQAQEKKLTYEKLRHRKGRSTTYQVLLFEQDYAQAELQRIGVQAQILQTVAQMKTFLAGDKS